MPEVIKFAKGTVAEHSSFTGENGEITLICDNTTNKTVTGIIRLHDGQTVGGIAFGGSQLLDDLQDVNATSVTIGTVLTAGANNTFSFSPAAESVPKGGGNNAIFFENDTTITDDYTITTGKNAMSAGPIAIANNATVVIPAGSTWTIV